ncbi:alpha/beta fold hydrolase [Rhodococcus olei]|uniref:Alpha/beta fold hydrolase n=1 Tax=Rhodococcus olei TaxID=2161675 RepID=A0ABP8NPY6_9NOCA
MADLVVHTDLHGDDVAYRLAGSGETVLLVHGMAASSRTWRFVLPELARGFRVLAPDLPGHGESAKPRGDYSLGAFAVTLRDLLAELGIGRVTVVGHSFGGGVAMQLAYQHPELCGRLVLISSGGLGREVSWMLRLLSAPGAELVLPLVALPPLALPVLAPPYLRPLGRGRLRSWLVARGVPADRAEEVWRAYASLSDTATRQAFLRTLRSVVDPGGQAVSAQRRLHRVGLPTQLVWGEADPIIPVSHGLTAHQAMPDSRIAVMQGVGHFPQVECPAAVVKIIGQFIAATPAAAAEGDG